MLLKYLLYKYSQLICIESKMYRILCSHLICLQYTYPYIVTGYPQATGDNEMRFS